MLFTPLPPRALARGGEGSGVGGSSTYSLPAADADRPPTPDPSPPLCGGRGEEKCAGPREMESALRIEAWARSCASAKLGSVELRGAGVAGVKVHLST